MNEKLDALETGNNCEAKLEIIPWDNYEEKYLTGSISNDDPDVRYMYMEMFNAYIDNGTLADIDSYFTDEEKENYVYYDLGNLMGGQIVDDEGNQTIDSAEGLEATEYIKGLLDKEYLPKSCTSNDNATQTI